MTKKASAIWSGGLKDGKGYLTTESNVLAHTPYGYNTRFEGIKGTNPEELIGAAHAGCFTMALSMILGEANLIAERLETHAQVTLEKTNSGFDITTVHLALRGRVPNATEAQFQEFAEKAKLNCPVSKLLRAHVTLDAILETTEQKKAS